MKRCCLALFVLSVIVYSIAPVAIAQEVKSKDQMPKKNDENSRHHKMRAMMRWRLVEYLDLNEEQSAQFFPIMKEADETRDKLMKEHRELIRKISEEIDDPAVSVKELKKYVDQLEKLKEEMLQARKKFLKKSEKVLEDRQYIKLLIFEDMLKADLFRRYRDKRSIDRSELEQKKIEREKK